MYFDQVCTGRKQARLDIKFSGEQITLLWSLIVSRREPSNVFTQLMMDKEQVIVIRMTIQCTDPRVPSKGRKGLCG